ncbi:hypothetical protein EIK77_002372 [Talaromyces pinophilus]|nr:hypothetical protein EIK77_002372 [Talaromyces pinophilus]
MSRDPFNYFGSHFKYPEILLAAMADTGSLLSGSRALEYFKPGSCEANSDWDFYVPGCESSVAQMMAALEACGVKFNVIWRDIEKLVVNPCGHSMKTTVRELRRVRDLYDSIHGQETEDHRTAWFDQNISPACMHIIRGICGRLAQAGDNTIVKVRKERTLRTNVVPFDDSDAKIVFEVEISDNVSSTYYGRDMSVISGHVPIGLGLVPVQMIITRPRHGSREPPTALDLITKFYASHVQCFISGWCAGQLFPELTNSMCPIEWNTDQGPPSERAKAKYRRRGYRFLPPTITYAQFGQNFDCKTFSRDYRFMAGVSDEDGRRLSNRISSLFGNIQPYIWQADPEGRLQLIREERLLWRIDHGNGEVPNFTQTIYNSLPAWNRPRSIPTASNTALVRDLQRSGLVAELPQTSRRCRYLL